NDEGVVQQVAVTRPRLGEADFDSLIRPHLDAGYRTALAMLRNPDEANDAVQDAAEKAWRRLHQLRDIGVARTWFLAIVANRCRSMRRTRWWSVIRLARVDREADFPSDTTDLERALAKLPGEDRLVLFLHFYLDLPFEEVGDVIGLSAAGAKTRVYRAAKKLRPDLEMN
ncbi:MAG TPA: RNA polymerase sigma factor, partial [Candidatus Dormibacteraeota bacterium]|nr:RNA polymerase sigma factor [Candidatus Dormibacteraeota bacterium]